VASPPPAAAVVAGITELDFPPPVLGGTRVPGDDLSNLDKGFFGLTGSKFGAEFVLPMILRAFG
jgi:hypothetical protein